MTSDLTSIDGTVKSAGTVACRCLLEKIVTIKMQVYMAFLAIGKYSDIYLKKIRESVVYGMVYFDISIYLFMTHAKPLILRPQIRLVKSRKVSSSTRATGAINKNF